MTQSAWNAGIEAAGTLTTALAAKHMAEALADGDAACVASVMAGTTLTAGALNSRLEIIALLSLYSVAEKQAPGTVLSAAARTQMVNRGSNYYTATGAP